MIRIQPVAVYGKLIKTDLIEVFSLIKNMNSFAIYVFKIVWVFIRYILDSQIHRIFP